MEPETEEAGFEACGQWMHRLYLKITSACPVLINNGAALTCQAPLAPV